jgi:hypothetical protein
MNQPLYAHMNNKRKRKKKKERPALQSTKSCVQTPAPPPPTKKKQKQKSWVSLAHIYNPSYSRSRAQEDRGSKPTLGK